MTTMHERKAQRRIRPSRPLAHVRRFMVVDRHRRPDQRVLADKGSTA